MASVRHIGPRAEDLGKCLIAGPDTKADPCVNSLGNLQQTGSVSLDKFSLCSKLPAHTSIMSQTSSIAVPVASVCAVHARIAHDTQAEGLAALDFLMQGKEVKFTLIPEPNELNKWIPEALLALPWVYGTHIERSNEWSRPAWPMTMEREVEYAETVVSTRLNVLRQTDFVKELRRSSLQSFLEGGNSVQDANEMAEEHLKGVLEPIIRLNMAVQSCLYDWDHRRERNVFLSRMRREERKQDKLMRERLRMWEESERLNHMRERWPKEVPMPEDLIPKVKKASDKKRKRDPLDDDVFDVPLPPRKVPRQVREVLALPAREKWGRGPKSKSSP